MNGGFKFVLRALLDASRNMIEQFFVPGFLWLSRVSNTFHSSKMLVSRNFYRWWKFENIPYEHQTTLLRIFHFSLSSEKNQSVRSLVVVSNLEVQANTRTVSMEKKKVRC